MTLPILNLQIQKSIKKNVVQMDRLTAGIAKPIQTAVQLFVLI